MEITHNEKLNPGYTKYRKNLEKWSIIKNMEDKVEALKNEIRESDPYFEIKVNNQVSIEGLPNNSVLIINGEDYLLNNGRVTFNGGSKLDFSKIYK